jgi:Uma2 family endonuclease
MKAGGLRRWSRDEYGNMIATGLFAPGERVELIDGEIRTVTPQGSLHATALRLVEIALQSSFGPGFDVRAQLPLACGTHSEPEPDVAVVAGTPRDYREAHPAAAFLVVEISDTTLEFDRQQKGSLYARSGIQEYWIVDLGNRCVEVYRDPGEGSYHFFRRFASGQRVSTLAAPGAEIDILDLLP